MEKSTICLTKEIKTVSKAGLQFIGDAEGCILHPYLDSANVATIGYGQTYYPNGKRVTMNDPKITLTQALLYFKVILPTYEKAVIYLRIWITLRNILCRQHQNLNPLRL